MSDLAICIASEFRRRRGLARQLSTQLGRSEGSVSQYVNGRRLMPAELVAAAAAATGIAAHVWRPDVFPAPGAADDAA